MKPSSVRTLLLSTSLLLVLSGCTSMRVDPLQAAPSFMCIKHNPKVLVSDFVPVMQEGFSRHGIETRVYKQAIPRAECQYLVTYSARRSWDMVPYLSQAELQILGPDRTQLASADYHLRGKGGLSPMKWQGTKAKIDPLLDQLLASVTLQPNSGPVSSAPQPATLSSQTYDERLQALQREPLSYEDYMSRLRELNRQYGRQTGGL